MCGGVFVCVGGVHVYLSSHWCCSSVFIHTVVLVELLHCVLTLFGDYNLLTQTSTLSDHLHSQTSCSIVGLFQDRKPVHTLFLFCSRLKYVPKQWDLSIRDTLGPTF